LFLQQKRPSCAESVSFILMPLISNYICYQYLGAEVIIIPPVARRSSTMTTDCPG
jgi:hypothetical protein